jgi:hypothetical protein
MIRHILTILLTFALYGELLAADLSAAGPLPYNDNGRRDPFWPLVGENGIIQTYDEDVIIGDLMLDGLMYADNNQGVAIINGRVLRAGERIGAFTVLRVENEAVVLIQDGQEYHLRLKKGE